jgi:putative transposase
MSDKFQNKYRIASTRLQNCDYRWNAPYFVTICIADRQHFFGEIVDGKMNLSHQGILADILWYEIKNHSKNVELGAFVVMPNHIHGIVILNNVDIPNEDNGTIVTDVGTGQTTEKSTTRKNNWTTTISKPG